MARYIVGRVLSSFLSLFVVSVIIFALMHAIPGGPFGNVQRGLSPTEQANILRIYGLNKPWWQQYLTYMNGFIHLNLGVAWQDPGEPMLTLISQSFAISASVAGIGLAYGIVGGLILGVIAAWAQRGRLDQFINALSTVLITTPSYVIALALIMVFAVGLHLFPAGGWGGFGGLSYMVLPAIAYGIGPLGALARYTRNAMAEELHRQHVTVAKAKGLKMSTLMVRHVLRNAAGPIITIVAPMIPGILTGSIFIEAIFNVPGLGNFFVTAVLDRDYPLELTLVLFVTIFTALTYLAGDLLMVLLDPRIQLGGVRYD